MIYFQNSIKQSSLSSPPTAFWTRVTHTLHEIKFHVFCCVFFYANMLLKGSNNMNWISRIGIVRGMYWCNLYGIF